MPPGCWGRREREAVFDPRRAVSDTVELLTGYRSRTHAWLNPLVITLIAAETGGWLILATGFMHKQIF